MAIILSAIYCRILNYMIWPIDWCGGKLVNLWKLKGDPQDCDNFRGLLLADHAAKGLTSIIKEDIDPNYCAHIPSHQYGAVRLRGTDFATHVVSSLIDLAAMLMQSIFVLFVDLVKAFDKVVREVVVGWGERPEHEHLEYLISLGVDAKAAEWIIQYIRTHGEVFQQWGVDRSTCDLARTLHENAWSQVAGSEQVITSRTGGRQGCKLGAMMFNANYSVALNFLTDRLESKGVALKLVVPQGTLWETPRHDDEVRPVVAVTFVDDLCVVVIYSSPIALDAAVTVLLEVLTTTFADMHLSRNWGPDKTEALLKYRGVGAPAAREKWRGVSGALTIPVPNSTTKLRIVNEYKHLGVYLNVTGISWKLVTHHVSSAQTAYTPIEFKVFGTQHLSARHKKLCCDSLVMSRLMFNLHIVTPTVRHMRKLASVYHRVLRRICDDPRFSGNVKFSDFEVRAQLQVMPIDALMMKARLRYLARILRNRPADLIAVLH
jgi:lactam utilization protein B